MKYASVIIARTADREKEAKEASMEGKAPFALLGSLTQ